MHGRTLKRRLLSLQCRMFDQLIVQARQIHEGMSAT